MNMILRVIAVFLMAVSVASADEHLRASKPKDCYLFSFGKGPDWSAKVAVEFRLSYLERKQPVVDETVFEPSDKALQWINYEKAPAVSTIATVKGRKIVRIEYSEPRSFEKTVGMVMLAVETAKGSEWFAPFFAAQPESFRGQFVSGPDVALGYITTLEYSGTGAFRTHHLFELGGDHPRLVRTLQAGRVVRNEFNSDAEYEEALKIYEEEDDLFSGILKAEKASRPKHSKP